MWVRGIYVCMWGREGSIDMEGLILSFLSMVKAELHPKPKLSMFCAQLSFEKLYDFLEANCLRNSKVALISRPSGV